MSAPPDVARRARRPPCGHCDAREFWTRRRYRRFLQWRLAGATDSRYSPSCQGPTDKYWTFALWRFMVRGVDPSEHRW